MPLYDFHCDKCGLDFEVSRSMKDSDVPAHCPMCDAAARRVFTMPMTFTRGAASAVDPAATPTPDAAAAAAAKWSHHGHSHGVGASSHSHGGRRTPPPADPTT